MTDGWQRLRLLISYEGSAFRGWQSLSDRSGVQDHIEKAFAEILGESLRIHGSGRTDAGVHAVGQVAHVDVPLKRGLTVDDWRRALNVRLIPQVRVMKVSKVAQDFHAQYSAREKAYRYRLINRYVLPPLEYKRAWGVGAELDFDLMKRAMKLFEGEHDFIGFAAKRKNIRSTVRKITLTRLRVQSGGLVTLDWVGDGFLYKMVRALTATVVDVGRGKVGLTEVKNALKNPLAPTSLQVAPAEGLYLLRVRY
ncbi:MAG: tRNA pseudouridine(38-40) synthase TruA [Chthoniobacterales bacterium]